MLSDTVVACALTYRDLSWSTDPDRYAHLLLPYDTEQARTDHASGSYSCGLTALAAIRDGGVDGRCAWKGHVVDVLLDPYEPLRLRGLSAITMLEVLARSRKAWRRPDTLDEIQPGWVVIVGGDGYGGAEHAIVVVGRDGEWLETIEGGQIDPGNGGKGTAIRTKRRKPVALGRGALKLPDDVHRDARRVYGAFCVDELCVLPEAA